MTVWAGVDIGNATTEVVLCRDLEVLAHARTPTRGGKGSVRAMVVDRPGAILVLRVGRAGQGRARSTRG